MFKYSKKDRKYFLDRYFRQMLSLYMIT